MLYDAEGVSETVGDREPLADVVYDTECDGDRELLLEAVRVILWLVDEVGVGVGGGVNVLVGDMVSDGDILLDDVIEVLREREGD